MISNINIELIPPDLIYHGDPCILWPEEPDHRFIQNLKSIGQIQPAVVVRENEKLQLVAGYKRCKAFLKLQKKIACSILPALDPPLKGLVYLSSNIGRTLSEASILSALRYFSSIDALSDAVWTNLDITPGSKSQGLWLNWIKLSRKWDILLAKRSITLECAPLLIKLPSLDLDAVYPFFSDLGWSRNNSLKFLTWLLERSVMDNCSVRDQIFKSGLNRHLETSLSPADKIKSIMRDLFRVRYPLLANLKQETDKRLHQASVNTLWKIEHKDEFESRDIVVNATVSNIKKLELALVQLQKITQSDFMKDWPVADTAEQKNASEK
ncbi:ParB N-terminal domain-containing protein [Desulfonatronovibrio magnus]|uniref:ParB N-terminal domain-containing protein n=1 Tax=Desulfonatronovibrio magnus TaxID=698827 RepID=UPI0005EB8ECF|nr:ParB N-terminal domain-containing protein [Desulfonatronovibrio magnus]RQD56938.1 MAG: hypothetical protein D5R98_09290 [Desulfonatronovibrio sp. MSAO_Bac4]